MTVTIEDVMDQNEIGIYIETITPQFHGGTPYDFYMTAYFTDTNGNCYEMNIMGAERRKSFEDAKKNRQPVVVTFSTERRGPCHVHRIVQSIEPADQ